MESQFSDIRAFAGSAAGNSAARLSPLSTPVYSAAPVHFARCFSLTLTGSRMPFAVGSPSGLGANDLQDAYKLPSATAGAGQTIAIVDAFDDTTAESDLATYRSFYGLPACTSSSGCFRKVNQTGGSIPPAPNPDWALEISLDLDMVSAVCPNCRILLVEATTNLDSDLYASEDTAARLGANAISNSWGGDESSDVAASDVHFDHPGVAITASSGDGGFGVSYPAASPLVTAGRRHVADDRGQRARLDRVCVERCRQRLQRVRAEAGVADGSRLRAPHRRGRLRGRRPEHRRRRAVREHVVHRRRDERLGADHRRRLRARRATRRR